jgi:hypothetical protein
MVTIINGLRDECVMSFAPEGRAAVAVEEAHAFGEHAVRDLRHSARLDDALVRYGNLVRSHVGLLATRAHSGHGQARLPMRLKAIRAGHAANAQAHSSHGGR